MIYQDLFLKPNNAKNRQKKPNEPPPELPDGWGAGGSMANVGFSPAALSTVGSMMLIALIMITLFSSGSLT